MQGHYNILDASFWEALRDAVSVLERAQLNYALVGGAASQFWIATLLTESGKTSIDEHPDLALRLRTTKDIDLSSHCEPHEMLNALNQLAALSGSGAYVLSPRNIRLRDVFVNLTIDPSETSGLGEHYDSIIENAVDLRLKRGTEYLHCRVEKLEYLVFTKLTRKGKQGKDLLDMEYLCVCLIDAGKKVSFSFVETLLADLPNAQALLFSYRNRFPEAFES